MLIRDAFTSMLGILRPAYSRRKHITAGELRKIGFVVRENVPDAAFVKRTALGLDGYELLEDGSPTVGVLVLESFAV